MSKFKFEGETVLTHRVVSISQFRLEDSARYNPTYTNKDWTCASCQNKVFNGVKEVEEAIFQEETVEIETWLEKHEQTITQEQTLVVQTEKLENSFEVWKEKTDIFHDDFRFDSAAVHIKFDYNQEEFDPETAFQYVPKQGVFPVHGVTKKPKKVLF